MNMKKEINPAVAGVVVAVIALIIIGVIFFKTQGSDGGARPTASQMVKGPGGKMIPGGPAPAGGGENK